MICKPRPVPSTWLLRSASKEPEHFVRLFGPQVAFVPYAGELLVLPPEAHVHGRAGCGELHGIAQEIVHDLGEEDMTGADELQDRMDRWPAGCDLASGLPP